MDGSDDSTPSRAEALFAEHLGHLEAAEPADLEALCREHPDQAAHLRRLQAAREALHGRLLEARPAVGEAPGASLLERLRVELGPEVDPGVTLRGADGSASAHAEEAVGRLAQRSEPFARYDVGAEIAHGGMGSVLRVWDQDLRRWLAMKRILVQRDGGPARVGALSPRALARFLEEAQVTAQLDHPGIVPVHELGLDAEGRVYFTMKLVEGRTLQAVFDELARGAGGWTQTRVLGLLQRVCEAMAYAHAKGVIHRDLKPANVMVGRFGEVYVMDWGLARVLDRDDEPVRTERGGSSDASPRMTLDGDVLGTPAYMPPEQARGDTQRLDERVDVYALGAMLYQLLAGRAPYARPDEKVTWHALLARVLAGPPPSLAQLAPSAPAELVAICDKAMARDPVRRYADMSAVAADLAAFVEGRVVAAYETGAWAEARKWVRRNKPLAAALAAAGLAVVAGGVAFALKAEEATLAATLATANEQEAREQRDLAAAETAKVLRLADMQRLAELLSESADLWPPHPAAVPALEAWLERARALVANLPRHRRTLEGMRASALVGADAARDRRLRARRDELELVEAELEGWISVLERGTDVDDRAAVEQRVAQLEERIGELEESGPAEPSWVLPDAEQQWQHDLLASLVRDLEAFLDPDPFLGDIASVERRLALASSIERRTLTGEEATARWAEARAAIRSAAVYGGLDLAPQVGLLPLGADPRSDLWEFAHLQSGEAAERGEDGRLRIEERTGIVLVLLPAGSFAMGTQAADPAGPNFDLGSSVDEQPVARVDLGAFFLSKYEMTRAQWVRATGRDPSFLGPEGAVGVWSEDAPELTLLHPVDLVSRDDCVAALRRLGLTLPTEAQWEYGARAGTDTPWWTGADPRSLQGAANLSDLSAQRFSRGIMSWPVETWLEDGAEVSAPVGSYRPNAFGLHDTVGNVVEWCLDGYGSYALAVRPGSGERMVHAPEVGVYRGGAFNGDAAAARVSYRFNAPPQWTDFYVGLRPARALGPR